MVKISTCQCRRTGFNLSWEDPLEKEMTPHSSILAWEIPRTEEPSGLQSMGFKGAKCPFDLQFLTWDFS